MFKDRRSGGLKIAELLASYANRPDVIVLGLPRGGVPVAYEVAAALNAPLDVFIVRKIGVPGHPELAMGAIASGGAYYLNEGILSRLNISREEIATVVRKEKEELHRREYVYRAGRPPLNLKNRRVILVDDGLATGASMLAAIRAVRELGPKEVVVAVPVSSRSSLSTIKPYVENIACVIAPYDFRSVGEWYEDFGQTTDEEVHQLLSDANHRTNGRPCSSLL